MDETIDTRPFFPSQTLFLFWKFPCYCVMVSSVATFHSVGDLFQQRHKQLKVGIKKSLKLTRFTRSSPWNKASYWKSFPGMLVWEFSPILKPSFKEGNWELWSGRNKDQWNCLGEVQTEGGLGSLMWCGSQLKPNISWPLPQLLCQHCPGMFCRQNL